MRADPDQSLRSQDAAGFLKRKVVLAEMDAVRLREQCDVRAIVDDEQRPAERVTLRRSRAFSRSVSIVQRFFAQLNHLGAAHSALRARCQPARCRHWPSVTST